MQGTREWESKGAKRAKRDYIMSLIMELTNNIFVTYYYIMANTVTEETNVTTRINDNGRIVIPAGVRKSMGLKPGDVVVMTLENGILRIEPHEAKIRRIQEDFRRFAKPGILASDELIADRREEARQEMEDWLG